MSSGAPALLLASTDRLLGEATAEYLRRRGGWDVTGPLGDGLQALVEMTRSPRGAVLVLGEVERLSPTAFVRQVARRWPTVAVVLVGDGREATDAAVALPWSAGVEEIMAALRHPPAERSGQDAPGQNGPVVDALRRLTPRERHILKLAGEGHSLPEISRHLAVSEHTARTHMQHLYEKLDCHSRLDVVLFAVRYGIASPGRAVDGDERLHGSFEA